MTGWVISPVPGRGLYRAEDGALALPLQISSGGRHLVVAELRLTPAPAEQLHAALCYALDGLLPPSDAPECRQPVPLSGRSAALLKTAARPLSSLPRGDKGRAVSRSTGSA